MRDVADASRAERPLPSLSDLALNLVTRTGSLTEPTPIDLVGRGNSSENCSSWGSHCRRRSRSRRGAGRVEARCGKTVSMRRADGLPAGRAERTRTPGERANVSMTAYGLGDLS